MNTDPHHNDIVLTPPGLAEPTPRPSAVVIGSRLAAFAVIATLGFVAAHALHNANPTTSGPVAFPSATAQAAAATFMSTYLSTAPNRPSVLKNDVQGWTPGSTPIVKTPPHAIIPGTVTPSDDTHAIVTVHTRFPDTPTSTTKTRGLSGGGGAPSTTPAALPPTRATPTDPTAALGAAGTAMTGERPASCATFQPPCAPPTPPSKERAAPAVGAPVEARMPAATSRPASPPRPTTPPATTTTSAAPAVTVTETATKTQTLIPTPSPTTTTTTAVAPTSSTATPLGTAGWVTFEVPVAVTTTGKIVITSPPVFTAPPATGSVPSTTRAMPAGDPAFAESTRAIITAFFTALASGDADKLTTTTTPGTTLTPLPPGLVTLASVGRWYTPDTRTPPTSSTPSGLVPAGSRTGLATITWTTTTGTTLIQHYTITLAPVTTGGTTTWRIATIAADPHGGGA